MSGRGTKRGGGGNKEGKGTNGGRVRKVLGEKKSFACRPNTCKGVSGFKGAQKEGTKRGKRGKNERVRVSEGPSGFEFAQSSKKHQEIGKEKGRSRRSRGNVTWSKKTKN